VKFIDRHFSTYSYAWIVVCVLFVSLLSGCGRHESAITGKVTVDGKLLTSGTVAFYPKSGGAAAYGSIQADGTYKIVTGGADGLAAGDYVVTVVATTGPQPGFPFGKKLTADRYGKVETSDLNFSVKPGSHQIDLELRLK
jgi:hypothetical protein